MNPGVQRVTEQIHPLTEHLDQQTPEAALACLFQAERELYEEHAWGPGLLDPAFLADLERLAAKIATVTADPEGRVIFAGAGTSGRLACLAATQWARNYGSQAGKVHGLLAGGWAAYYHAKEVVEDSVAVGQADIAPLLAGPGPVVYIGISCGLSAAYVAGQLALCRRRAHTTTVVLGFTPPDTAVDRTLPGLPPETGSMRALIAALATDADAFVLTPMIGAEPIAGSTRMKGGSATRILLDGLAFPGRIRARLAQYQVLLQQLQRQSLGEVVAWAGETLKRGGSLTYVAAGETAPMALLDASECPPTFGAQPFQVQAVCAGLAEQLPDFDGTDHDLAAYQRRARVEDGFVWMAGAAADPALAAWRKDLAADAIRSLPPFPTHLFDAGTLMGPLRDLWFKWQCNALSTLAFVAYGKVLGNRMVDLRISNQKLWHRGIGLIADLAVVSSQQAEDALHRALGQTAETPLDDKIRAAVRSERLITRAVLTARGWDPEAARAEIAREPRLVSLLTR
ncbi:hypothetical protein [Acanthopleuribacter pedis]|uniref:SIS domain-containing protein n=1 Tax=Acanthopleuribacter pedis TaxID=442870 RepID=A0A8J7U8E3_9BACT|nr:hypothetical protein [Acanthopleuribacter pedis]MBO1322446.1 hypothetical protein [Acanthopleuribacter pedis]